MNSLSPIKAGIGQQSSRTGNVNFVNQLTQRMRYRYVQTELPARTTIEVSGLGLTAEVEIDAVAVYRE